ncbi:high frequency lysogenization protein HflD [Neiella marina]|uniref:High frequency lysogenization protein HflD homolog n=1 Tax=Neiella holothuriorum TaxID=2870530 RepID=A0ABS7EL98_9GAMM|nr:high frequency lysogenization protein HflD [Neiella holothuriorum]MBW8192457.1 high frequency lysogenization protein HflD [Neiella holothuriorum]
MSNYVDRVIALSGVCQSAYLVSQIARNGSADADLMEVALNSILLTEPEQTEDVYGGLGNVRTGARHLLDHLAPKAQPRNMDVFRYAVAMLALERRLAKTNGAFAALAERIEHSKRQLSHSELLDDQMVAGLASIYSDIVSPVGQRIQVAGAPANLKPEANQNKIRATLLAGVRAAVLWRQLGGNRLQFLLGRKKMVAATQSIISF